MSKTKVKLLIYLLIALLIIPSFSFAIEPISEDLGEEITLTEEEIEALLEELLSEGNGEAPINDDTLAELDIKYNDVYHKSLKEFILNQLLDGNAFIKAKDFKLDSSNDNGIIDGDLFVSAMNVTIGSNTIYSDTQTDEEGNAKIEDITDASIISGNLVVIANKLVIEPGCIINGNLFVIANEVIVHPYASVYGNFYAVANTLEFNGFLSKDLYATVNNYSMNFHSYVVRDIHLVANKAVINGRLNRNSFIEAKQLITRPEFVTYGNLEVEAKSFTFVGEVFGDLKVNANKFNIITPDNLEDNRKLIEKTFELEPLLEGVFFSTIIHGNLDYTSSKELELTDGVVLGDINYTGKSSIFFFMKSVLSWLITLCALLLYVVPIFFLMKKKSPQCLENIATFNHKTCAKSLGIGIGLVIAVPLILVLLSITVVGIPLAGLLGIAFMLLALVGVPIVLIAISQIVKRIIGDKILKDKVSETVSEYLHIIDATIVFSLLLLIPVANAIILGITILIGLGYSAILFVTAKSETAGDRRKETPDRRAEGPTDRRDKKEE